MHVVEGGREENVDARVQYDLHNIMGFMILSDF